MKRSFFGLAIQIAGRQIEWNTTARAPARRTCPQAIDMRNLGSQIRRVLRSTRARDADFGTDAAALLRRAHAASLLLSD
jgi:hypothetical protein